MNNKTHNPLFHVSKRAALPWYRAWAIRGAALVLALLACALVTTMMTGENPLKIYVTIFEGSFGTSRRIWMLCQNIAMLLCVSLAITPAFRMRCWNLGGDGQMLAGCLATAACMILLGDKLPNWLLIVVVTFASVAAGAIWGLIPAVFKAKWNTNETLFTLMMNYIIIGVVAWLQAGPWEARQGRIAQFPQVAWLPKVEGVHCGWIIVLLLVFLVHIYMRHTKQGYEIAVIGDSLRTAQYAGMNVGRIMMRTMFLSGAISGLVGFILCSGATNTLSKDIAGGVGFTSITVAWLSQLNAFAMVAISLMLGILTKGADTLQTVMNVPAAISDIIIGLLLFCMLGCEFFINYRLILRKKSRKGGDGA